MMAEEQANGGKFHYGLLMTWGSITRVHLHERARRAEGGRALVVWASVDPRTVKSYEMQGCHDFLIL